MGTLRLRRSTLAREPSAVWLLQGSCPSRSGIADGLERAIVLSIITKIEDSNVPSRRAVSKIGFEGIATMHYRRLGPSSSTAVKAGYKDKPPRGSPRSFGFEFSYSEHLFATL